MSDFKAKIYVAEITFSTQVDCLERFCGDLGIIPEWEVKIEEDSWGLLNSLEIWFQEIEPRKLTLHIQKKHFKQKKTYLQDLENFREKVESLSYVRDAKFI